MEQGPTRVKVDSATPTSGESGGPRSSFMCDVGSIWQALWEPKSPSTGREPAYHQPPSIAQKQLARTEPSNKGLSFSDNSDFMENQFQSAAPSFAAPPVLSRTAFRDSEIEKARKLEDVLVVQGVMCELIIAPPKGSTQSIKGYKALLKISPSRTEFKLEIGAHKSVKRIVCAMSEVIAINKDKGMDLQGISTPIRKPSSKSERLAIDGNDSDDKYFHFRFESKPEINLRVECLSTRDSLTESIQCILWLRKTGSVVTA